MDRIEAGIRTFREQVFPQRREQFRALAGGQSPELLLITCSDSRIDPALLTQSEPGDLFVIRNAGNLVPPAGGPASGEAATIQYGVEVLGIPHIAVCGHRHCGAMAALDQPEAAEGLPAVREWLEFARPALGRSVRLGRPADPALETVAANVLAQLEHLRSHPSVAAAEARGDLTVHGWIYDFEEGELLVADEHGHFAPLSDDDDGGEALAAAGGRE